MADEQGDNHLTEPMYELELPAPQLTSTDGRGPVLIHALEGFSDAGHAIRLAAEHLKSSLDTEVVASFAIDDLLDYRSRRPLMTFKTDHFTSYDEPELNLYALRDSVGTQADTAARRLAAAWAPRSCCWPAWSPISNGSVSSVLCACSPSDSVCAAPSAWEPSRWPCRTPGPYR